MSFLPNVLTNFLGFSIILVIMLYGRANRKHDLEYRLFDLLQAMCLLVLVFDAGTWLFEGSALSWGGILLHASNMLSFFSMLLTGIVWVIYCDCRLSGTRKLQMRHAIYCIPTLVHMVLMVLNLKTGWVYTIDSENIYHRGELYFVIILFDILYVLFSVVIILIRSRKKTWMQRHDSYGLLLFIAPPILSALIQGFFYGISLASSLAVSILIIYLQQQNALITQDPLTRLNNRRVYEHYLQQKIHSLREDSCLFLLMIDMDHFKQINDTYGHRVGDEALVAVADLLRKSCVAGDCVVRLGGDEFGIVGQRKERDEVQGFMQHIQQMMAKLNEQNAGTYQLSLSIGHAIYDAGKHANIDEFLHAADRQMYAGRKQKR